MGVIAEQSLLNRSATKVPKFMQHFIAADKTSSKIKAANPSTHNTGDVHAKHLPEIITRYRHEVIYIHSNTF